MNTKNLIKDVFKEMTEVYNSINDYVIEIGIVSSKNSRNKKDKIKNKKDDGIGNAELMFIHENGSPIRNIPERPVLQITIEHAINVLLPKTLKKIQEGCFKQNWTKERVKKELENLCNKMQNYARNVIYESNLLAPNAPRTIKAKGSDRPLLDTGQLARSITCRLVSKK